MDVKVTATKKEQLKDFMRRHKKGIICAGALVASVGCYVVLHDSSKPTKEQLEEWGKFIEKVLRPGVGANLVYTECDGDGGVIAKVSDLGRLGESMSASLGQWAPDTEVVGVVVYTK